MILSEEEVLQQSRTAFKQWEDLWRTNCTKNAEIIKSGRAIPLRSIAYSGMGKTVVCTAMGASFQDDIHIIKKYRGKRDFDIIAVDKSAMHLQDHGIKPDYVIIADASIGYKWIDGYDSTGVTLLANVNSNPEWALNWKGPIAYFVNKDNIESEKIFMEISGCREQIAAASNVGNAAVVVATSVFDYETVLLSGYDFSWNKRYYAFSKFDAAEKRSYMSHMISINHMGEVVNTSNNLHFSCRWLSDFLKVAKKNVFIGNKKTTLNAPFLDLERQLAISRCRPLSKREVEHIIEKTKLVAIAPNVAELQKLHDENPKTMLNKYVVELIPEEICERLNL